MISDIQEKIIQLKKEKDIAILAHSYQSPEILEIADLKGDSFKSVSYTHLTVTN